MNETWVEVPLNKVSDDILRDNFVNDDLVYELCRKRFSSFMNDWLYDKHFYTRKIDDMKVEFSYDIDITIDDIREYYDDGFTKFYHDIEIDDWKCE